MSQFLSNAGTTRSPLRLLATDTPGPSATSCSLATRSRGELVGAAVAVPFTFSLLRVLEELGPGGGRKSWAVKRQQGKSQLLSSDLQEGLGRTWVSPSLGPSHYDSWQVYSEDLRGPPTSLWGSAQTRNHHNQIPE